MRMLLRCLTMSRRGSLEMGHLTSGFMAVGGLRDHLSVGFTNDGYPDLQMPISSPLTSSLRYMGKKAGDTRPSISSACPYVLPTVSRKPVKCPV